MASITKKATGWRVELYVNGIRECKTHPTKNEASAWANDREAELRQNAQSGIKAIKTCEEAFEKYIDEISKHKKGERWERVRLNACANYEIGGKRFGDIFIKDVDATTMAQYRDMRLKTVLGSTVNREFNLLSNVFTVARKEWKWTNEKPISDVKRPKEAKARNRLVSEDDLEQMRIALGYKGTVENKMHALYVAFLFAIETGMRQGEIASLTWDCVFPNHAHLTKSKNGDSRDVPLSQQAITLLSQLPKKDEYCFGLKADYMSTTFRKTRDTTLIENLHFHDSRHEAITRLAKKLNVLELARMVGHKDIRELMTYYNETAAEIAKKL